MSPIESIIYMLWRGVAVGVLISAPMGPVGILCIQRTLDKGRHAGLYTGIGAAISDLIYCLLTGFGLSFIEDFLESNQNIIQLIGSLVLIAFSVYLFRKDPQSPHRPPVGGDISAKKNILGGFLFTFSNPLIIFLIIGLFARFNFTLPEINGAYYAVGYLGIIAGALGWWWTVTYAINKVRSRFTMKSMKALNVMIGLVILIFAGVGIVTSLIGLFSPEAKATRLKPSVVYAYPAGQEEKTISNPSSAPFAFPLAAASRAMTLDFKLAPSGNSPGWTVLIGDPAHPDPEKDISYTFSVAEHEDSPLSSRPALTCATSLPGGQNFISAPRFEDLSLPGGFNHYRILITPEGESHVLAGHTSLRPLIRSRLPLLPATDSIYLILPGKSRAAIKDLRVTFHPYPGLHNTPLTADSIRRQVATRKSGEPTGIWKILDWTLDTELASTGGDYALGIVKGKEGDGFLMIYLGGAGVNASAWREGMIKGELAPTGIPHVYDLIWIDAAGAEMTDGLRAEFDPETAVINLFFPRMGSSIRLSRIE